MIFWQPIPTLKPIVGLSQRMRVVERAKTRPTTFAISKSDFWLAVRAIAIFTAMALMAVDRFLVELVQQIQ